MRTLTLLALVLCPVAAFAGELPISGHYCAKDAFGVDNAVLGARGITGEDDLRFAQATKTGPRAWTVTYQGSDYVGWTGKITISADEGTATIAGTAGSMRLYRCR